MTTPLGETTDSAVATRVENSIKSLINPRPKGHRRAVKVTAVDAEHFLKFSKSGKRPTVGQVFVSAVQAAAYVGAHANALTSAFSAAKHSGLSPVKASIRGITFVYAD